MFGSALTMLFSPPPNALTPVTFATGVNDLHVPAFCMYGYFASVVRPYFWTYERPLTR